MSLSDIGIGSTVKRGRRKSGGRYRFDARVKSGGKKKGRNSGSDRVYQLGAVLLLLFVLAGLGAVLFAGFVFAGQSFGISTFKFYFFNILKLPVFWLASVIFIK